MTDPTPPLDGITLPAPGHGSPIEAAVEQTIAALRSDGLIEPRHEAMCELARSMASAIGASARYGRGASQGLAVCARELREALSALPHPPEDGGQRAEFDRLVDALRGTEVRDGEEPRPAD